MIFSLEDILTEEKAIDCINSSNKPHYVYLLIDPRDNIPFYVGKGSGGRCFNHWYEKDSINNIKKGRIRNIRDSRMEVLYVLDSFWSKEINSFSRESDLISYYGKISDSSGILCNIADGLMTEFSGFNKQSDIIKRFIEVHGNKKFDYKAVVYRGFNTDVEIRCIEHNKIYWQQPANHLQIIYKEKMGAKFVDMIVLLLIIVNLG